MMVWLFFCRHSELRSPYLPVILRPFGTIVVRLFVLKKDPSISQRRKERRTTLRYSASLREKTIISKKIFNCQLSILFNPLPFFNFQLSIFSFQIPDVCSRVPFRGVYACDFICNYLLMNYSSLHIIDLQCSVAQAGSYI